MASKRDRHGYSFDADGSAGRSRWIPRPIRRAFDRLANGVGFGGNPLPRSIEKGIDKLAGAGGGVHLPRSIEKGIDKLAGAGGRVGGLRLPRPLRRAVGYFANLQPVLQALIALTASGVLIGGAYFLIVYRPHHLQQRAVALGWKSFGEALETVDEGGLRKALDDIVAAGQPVPPLAFQRLKALDTLEADPADEVMSGLTMRIALRKNDIAAADREAEKLIAKQPKNWFALCVRAQAALIRGDRDAAVRQLDALPAVTDEAAQLYPPTGILFALNLFRATGRDTDPLLTFIRVKLLPALKLPTVQNMPAPLKTQMLECYLEAFETAPGRPQPAGISGSWAAAGQLFDKAAAELVESGEVPSLVALGRVAGRLSAGLVALHKDGQVTDEQFPPLKAEMIDRGKRVWEAVLAKDTKNAEAYRGLALLRFQGGDYPGARETVVKGLTACGDDPALAALFATMLQAEDRPELAAAALWQSAEKYPDKAVWWVLAAESAAAANRRDLALEACRRGLKVEPNNPWLIRLEGRLWMDAGDPNRAAQSVRGLGYPALVADPAVARVYARALVESGLEVLVDEYLAEVDQSARDRDAPDAAAAALRGLFDANVPADRPRMEQLADRADRLVARWREHPELLRVRALAMARAAELGAPPWGDVIRTQSAVSALERVLAKFSDDREMAAALAWVRLKGQRNPAQALADIVPVARAEPVQPLPTDQLEVLGAVLLASNKPAEAAAVLDRTKKANPTVRGMTLLARANLAAGRKDDARAALKIAAGLPHSDRDHADYLETARALEQEKP